jgi:hypothetical protein
MQTGLKGKIVEGTLKKVATVVVFASWEAACL